MPPDFQNPELNVIESTMPLDQVDVDKLPANGQEKEMTFLALSIFQILPLSYTMAIPMDS